MKYMNQGVKEKAMVIDDLIQYAKDNDCSDIHISALGEIALRQYGQLRKLENASFTEENLNEMIYEMMDGKQTAIYNSGKDLDFSYQSSSGIRCRVNTYHEQDSNAACLRIIGTNIPKIDELNLPEAVRTLSEQPNGLVLITGPTGSGKSTTLAAMIDYINQNKAEHVLTIEDPIEFVHKPYYSTIHQREVGRDVPSFADALRSSLREDPDVILVGEMRDLETVSAVMTAAETGHLVVSTLHTTSAADTINRIIDFFPPHNQAQVRTRLASILRGIVAMRLVPTLDGRGRVPATEVLINTDAIANLIRTDKVHQIDTALQTGMKDGMHTLNHNLKQLIVKGMITQDVAKRWSNNPKELI